MPDGEFFTGLVEDSAEGEVTFHLPAVVGAACSGVKLRFEGGKVIDATAEQGEEFLVDMLDTDAGRGAWASSASAPTMNTAARGTSCSTRRSAEPSTSPSGPATPRPVVSTTAPCTPTSSATRARAAGSRSTQRSCSRTASSV